MQLSARATQVYLVQLFSHRSIHTSLDVLVGNRIFRIFKFILLFIHGQYNMDMRSPRTLTELGWCESQHLPSDYAVLDNSNMNWVLGFLDTASSRKDIQAKSNM